LISDEKGFACGWIYWIGYVFSYPSKLVSIQKIMSFWCPNAHSAVIISVFLPVPLLINYLPARRYGEIEYWITILKITAICGIILLGVLFPMDASGNTPLLATVNNLTFPCPSNPEIGECVGRQGFGCMSPRE
jgi:amino acid permease